MGEKIAREIRTTKRHQYSIVGFVDDDKKEAWSTSPWEKIFGNVRDL